MTSCHHIYVHAFPIPPPSLLSMLEDREFEDICIMSDGDLVLHILTCSGAQFVVDHNELIWG